MVDSVAVRQEPEVRSTAGGLVRSLADEEDGGGFTRSGQDGASYPYFSANGSKSGAIAVNMSGVQRSGA